MLTNKYNPNKALNYRQKDKRKLGRRTFNLNIRPIYIQMRCETFTYCEPRGVVMKRKHLMFMNHDL